MPGEPKATGTTTVSVQIELESIEGLKILRERAQEKIDQRDPLPVCMSPRGLVAMLNWVIPLLEAIPPKHHLPTTPVASERNKQGQLGSRLSNVPEKGSNKPASPPAGSSGSNGTPAPAKRRRRHKKGQSQGLTP